MLRGICFFICLLFSPFLGAHQPDIDIFKANELTSLKLIDPEKRVILTTTLKPSESFHFIPQNYKQGCYTLDIKATREGRRFYLFLHRKLPGGLMKIEHKKELHDDPLYTKHHCSFQLFNIPEGDLFIDARGYGNIEDHADYGNSIRHFSFSPGLYRMEFFDFDGSRKGDQHLVSLDLDLKNDLNITETHTINFLTARL